MNFKKIFLTLFTLTLIFLAVYFLFFHKTIENINYIKLSGQIIKVETASTPEMQEKGLSGRKEIKENEGMLFVFENSGNYSFWMKDMNFPIDIIWLNEQKEVVFFKENVSPSTFPETFSPDKDSKYVLEVIAGFSQKNNLKIGERAQFIP
jgi:hypothetical protein